VGFFQAQSDVSQYFSDNWSHTQVDYGNIYFDPKNLDEWVRFTDQVSTGRRASLGDNPLYRYVGMVTVQIFVKPNAGEARALELCDFVTALFRDQRINGTQFRVPQPNKIGVRDGWYQVNAVCHYYRDEE
jgi:hypothetical protein